MRAASIVKGLAVVVAATVFGSQPSQAQYTLNVDPRMSLAWWQINPHLGHLWATTCPSDPSWRPGEGRSISWAQQFLSMRSKTGYANVMDTIIPLYPRRKARALCGEAVSGTITASDTTQWKGVKGTIVLQADQLTTGLDMRDRYANESILNTKAYPTIKFTIDSLASMTKARGDTLTGQAFGVFELHGITKPMRAAVKTWHEPTGQRVSAKFMIPAADMTEVYHMSKYSLGLGVGGTVWQELWLGVDVILKPAGT